MVASGEPHDPRPDVAIVRRPALALAGGAWLPPAGPAARIRPLRAARHPAWAPPGARFRRPRDQQLRHRRVRAVGAGRGVRAAGRRDCHRPAAGRVPRAHLDRRPRARTSVADRDRHGGVRARPPAAAVRAVVAGVPAARAAGAAVPRRGGRPVVDDARRARRQLLPRRAPARVATRQAAGHGPCRGLRAAGRVAARALAVRDPDPGVRARDAGAVAGAQRGDDARPAATDRAAAGVVVGAVDRDHDRHHLGVPPGVGCGPRLGGHRRAARPAAGRRVPGRVDRRRIPLRRPGPRWPPVPGPATVRGAEGSGARAGARRKRGTRSTRAPHRRSGDPRHARAVCLGNRHRLVARVATRPAARSGDHGAPRGLGRGTREHARRIPRGDGGAAPTTPSSTCSTRATARSSSCTTPT